MSCDTIAAKESNFCGESMLIPEQVQKIFNLHSIGWGKKRIAKELGVSTKTQASNEPILPCA